MCMPKLLLNFDFPLIYSFSRASAVQLVRSPGLIKYRIAFNSPINKSVGFKCGLLAYKDGVTVNIFWQVSFGWGGGQTLTQTCTPVFCINLVLYFKQFQLFLGTRSGFELICTD